MTTDSVFLYNKIHQVFVFSLVPSLENILEPMLRKKHGSKANKGWGKDKNLITQSLKSIETLPYQ